MKAFPLIFLDIISLQKNVKLDNLNWFSNLTFSVIIIVHSCIFIIFFFLLQTLDNDEIMLVTG